VRLFFGRWVVLTTVFSCLFFCRSQIPVIQTCRTWVLDLDHTSFEQRAMPEAQYTHASLLAETQNMIPAPCKDDFKKYKYKSVVTVFNMVVHER
jgi:uncharacterized protein with HEPN domain